MFVLWGGMPRSRIKLSHRARLTVAWENKAGSQDPIVGDKGWKAQRQKSNDIRAKDFEHILGGRLSI